MNDEVDAADSGDEASSRPEPIGFVDQQRVLWCVVERDARRDPGARASRCLIFSCQESIRRVWNYPANWRELGDADLEALSWKS